MSPMTQIFLHSHSHESALSAASAAKTIFAEFMCSAGVVPAGTGFPLAWNKGFFFNFARKPSC